jgi:hypothetical protein
MKAPVAAPFVPTERQEKALKLLRDKGSHHASSIAHIHNFAGGEASALTELRLLETAGLVEHFTARGSLLWRAKSPAK